MAGTDDLRRSGDQDLRVGPGWYPSPVNDAQVRWWDGQRWGPTPSEARDAGWWLASDGRYYPPGQPSVGQMAGAPVGSLAGGAEPPAPGKRFYARWWFWALVIVSVPVAAIGLYVLSVLALIGPDDYDYVYVEDFDTGAGEFELWEEPEGSAAVVDGVYVMTNRNSGKSLTVGVRGPWTADRARIDARMELTESADQDGFGLQLGRTDGERYLLALSPGSGARITGPGVECQGDSPLTDVRGGDIALSGEYDGTEDVTILTGYLDGRVIVTCVDEGFDSNNMGAFSKADLWLYADAEPATVEVDDVTVAFRRYTLGP